MLACTPDVCTEGPLCPKRIPSTTKREGQSFCWCGAVSGLAPLGQCTHNSRLLLCGGPKGRFSPQNITGADWRRGPFVTTCEVGDGRLTTIAPCGAPLPPVCGAVSSIGQDGSHPPPSQHKVQSTCLGCGLFKHVWAKGLPTAVAECGTGGGGRKDLGEESCLEPRPIPGSVSQCTRDHSLST